MSEPRARLGIDRGWERPRVLEAFFGPDAVARDAHGVIDASAGTGKTYTLEHLVLELVAAGAPIEEILVVTFTDKATREMKQRVRARLVAARARLVASLASHVEVPDEARTLLSRLTTAVASFDRASISTIHAFCQRALAEHAFASGRPFTFERTDGRESFGRAVRQAVRAGLASGASERPGHRAFRSALVALRAAGSEGAVTRLEALLHAWMREPGEVRPAFSPDQAARALLSTPTASELLSPRWASLLAEVPSLTARARIRDALLELATEIAPHRDTLAAALERGEDCADQLVWGPALAWASSSTDPRAIETNAALCATHTVALPELAETFRVLHRALGSPVPYLVHTILPRVRDLWAREKRETSTLDFDDMLTALRDALASDVAVRRALRARYRHALVDEFQDTDEVQWEIFRRLFVDRDDEEVVDESREAHARTLFVIGDVKQAIYGFRSADVHTFEDACRTLERAGAARAVLDESFRSSPAMLEALDHVFAARTDAPTRDPSGMVRGLAGYTQRVTSGVPERSLIDRDGNEAPAVVIQHLVGAPELRLPLIRRALADAIAKEIRALTGEGLRLRDDARGDARPVKLSDVFVLTRSAVEGRDVAEALRRHAVPHAFFKQDGLFRTREASDVLDVLRALADRHDRDLATRALLGPFFGVPLGELPAAHAIDSGHPLARRLTRWASLAEHGQLAALLSAMLDGAGNEGSGVARRELYLHEGERVLVNLRHLLEWLLELGTRRRLSIAELALELSQRIEHAKDERAGSDDEDVQKLESEREAVQILTMHKSKGLEAEVVFVFGGWGKPPKRRLMPRVVHERVEAAGEEARVRRVAWAVADDGISEKDVVVETSGGPVPLREALRAEARAEDERLYYVALTRAKRRLYLPYFGTPPRPLPRRDDVTYDPPHLKGSYAVLNDRLRALAEDGALTAAPFSVVSIDVGPRVRARAGSITLPSSPSVVEGVLAPLPTSDRARLVSRHAGFEVTSYTRMKSLARARAEAAGEGSQVDVAPSLALLAGETPIETPSSGTREPGGASFGVLVHGLLEDLLRARALETSEESIAVHPSVIERLRVHAPTEEERTLALSLASRAMTAPLDDDVLRLPGGVASLPRRVAEMPFLFPVPERAHAPIERLGGEDGFVIERGYVRGVIDLLFEHEGRVFVLDWKTDRLTGYDAASLRAHVEHDYRVQIALYTLAALRVIARGAEGMLDTEALHARFGGLVYVFVRGLRSSGNEGDPRAPGDGILTMRPSLPEVLEWERAARHDDGLLGAPLPPRREPLAPPTLDVEEP
ncbi:MAG: UvrD-helicase domain-containing protein [Deltaproteobacteria bacterium]|nr:UvrD-helicase domain-containing protein [Deltaproteobacteria bacterium]